MQQHSVHDTTLIAGLAAGDLAGTELDRARTLLSACTDCADLHRDLLAIAAAARALPNLAHAPRDFRIDAAQADRLVRGSLLRRILRPFAATRSTVQPLATAFTSLGVAGLLVVTFLPGILGGVGGAQTASGPRELAGTGAPAPTSAPAAPIAGGAVGAASQEPVRVETDANNYGGWLDSGKPLDVKDGGAQATEDDALAALGAQASQAAGETDAFFGLNTATPPNPVFVGSLALLAIGLALFGLRFAGRRLR